MSSSPTSRPPPTLPFSFFCLSGIQSLCVALCLHSPPEHPPASCTEPMTPNYFFFLSLFKKNLSIIYLVALGLSCGTQDFLLRRKGFVVAFQGLCSQTRDSTHIPCTEGRFLTPGLQGKSLSPFLKTLFLLKVILSQDISQNLTLLVPSLHGK